MEGMKRMQLKTCTEKKTYGIGIRGEFFKNINGYIVAKAYNTKIALHISKMGWSIPKKGMVQPPH